MRKYYRASIEGAGPCEICVIGSGDRMATIASRKWKLTPANYVLVFRKGPRGTLFLGYYSGKKVSSLRQDTFGHPEWGPAYVLPREKLRSPEGFFALLDEVKSS